MTFVLMIIKNVNNIVRTKIIGHYSSLVTFYSEYKNSFYRLYVYISYTGFILYYIKLHSNFIAALRAVRIRIFWVKLNAALNGLFKLFTCFFRLFPVKNFNNIQLYPSICQFFAVNSINTGTITPDKIPMFG